MQLKVVDNPEVKVGLKVETQTEPQRAVCHLKVEENARMNLCAALLYILPTLSICL